MYLAVLLVPAVHDMNTSCPATYGSYRINKVDPLVYTEKLTQQNIHCKSNMGEFQIATK